LSSENEYKKLLIIGTLIGTIGSVGLIIGMIFDFIGAGIKILDTAILAWGIGIFILCLITFFGALTPSGLIFNDERPSLFALALFIFAPTIVISEYGTPMIYLLQTGNELLSTGSAGFVNYLTYIGIALLLVAFVILSWIFLWKKRFSFTGASGQVTDEDDIGIVKFMRILTGIIAIVAGVGLIIGLLVKTSSTALASLLMSEDGSNLDLTALALMVFILGIIVTAVIMLLSNFGVGKLPKSEIPTIVLLFMLIALPGYAPESTSLTVWTTPIFKILEYGKVIFNNIVFMGWLLIFSALALVLAFMLGILTYFMNTTATYVERAARPKTVRRDRRQPSALEQYAQTEGLASQLATTTETQPSFMPSTSTGPPSGPPSGPPTGSPTGTAAQAESPTCPFCSKKLRFIEEYQRWYCDSCAQYV
jgi:hypothetical protein